MKPGKFVVWQQGKEISRYEHDDEATARHEAETLALTYPADRFVVLYVIATCKKASVIWDDPNKEDLPF